MSRALRQSVNVYTEINLETMQYRQMNLKNAKHYSVIPEGDYGLAFDHMIHDEIDPDDGARGVSKTGSRQHRPVLVRLDVGDARGEQGFACPHIAPKQQAAGFHAGNS